VYGPWKIEVEEYSFPSLPFSETRESPSLNQRHYRLEIDPHLYVQGIGIVEVRTIRMNFLEIVEVDLVADF